MFRNEHPINVRAIQSSTKSFAHSFKHSRSHSHTPDRSGISIDSRITRSWYPPMSSPRGNIGPFLVTQGFPLKRTAFGFARRVHSVRAAGLSHRPSAALLSVSGLVLQLQKVDRCTRRARPIDTGRNFVRRCRTTGTTDLHAHTALYRRKNCRWCNREIPYRARDRSAIRSIESGYEKICQVLQVLSDNRPVAEWNTTR